MPPYLSTNTKLRSHRCLQKTSGRRAGARLPIRYETNNMTSNMTPLEAAMSPELNKTVGFVLIPTACPT
jgi:hypothetical protein